MRKKIRVRHEGKEKLKIFLTGKFVSHIYHTGMIFSYTGVAEFPTQDSNCELSKEMPRSLLQPIHN